MKAPPKTSSSWADEGTAAHSMAEQCLRTGRAPFEYLGTQIDVAGRKWPVTNDMIRAVGNYVGHLWQRKAARPKARCFIERKLYVPELNQEGTVDHLILDVEGKALEVDDYKHGAGVYVSEVWNAQFLAYALGAFESLWPRPNDSDLPLDIEVRLTVHQPRFPESKPARTQIITSGQLLEWRRTKLWPGLEASILPNAPLKGGDHCRFCPAKPICAEYLTVQKPRFQAVPIQASPIPADFKF